MFSRRTVLILILLTGISFNAVILFFAVRSPGGAGSEDRIFPLTAPFQEVANRLIDYCSGWWRNYFFLASVSEENDRLKKELEVAAGERNRCAELELANSRLRELLALRRKTDDTVLAAEVIGKDPSPWYRSLIINRGRNDGLQKSFPVMVPEGVVGVITHVSDRYARVLLLIDRNSAVDALVQRTRARGIVKGDSAGGCVYEYVLRRHEIEIGDTVISSGLDGVFPKGLRVGKVSEVIRRAGGIFQEIRVEPFVDFEKLEEVLIIFHLSQYTDSLP